MHVVRASTAAARKVPNGRGCHQLSGCRARGPSAARRKDNNENSAEAQARPATLTGHAHVMSHGGCGP